MDTVAKIISDEFYFFSSEIYSYGRVFMSGCSDDLLKLVIKIMLKSNSIEKKEIINLMLKRFKNATIDKHLYYYYVCSDKSVLIFNRLHFSINSLYPNGVLKKIDKSNLYNVEYCDSLEEHFAQLLLKKTNPPFNS